MFCCNNLCRTDRVLLWFSLFSCTLVPSAPPSWDMVVHLWPRLSVIVLPWPTWDRDSTALGFSSRCSWRNAAWPRLHIQPSDSLYNYLYISGNFSLGSSTTPSSSWYSWWPGRSAIPPQYFLESSCKCSRLSLYCLPEIYPTGSSVCSNSTLPTGSELDGAASSAPHFRQASLSSNGASRVFVGHCSAIGRRVGRGWVS